MKWRIVRLIGVLLVALGMMGAPGALAQDATPAAAPKVDRTILSQGEPVSAPGQNLQLVRFDIPAHFKLPVHNHPGMQAAYLVSGTLIYNVVADGTVAITRASASTGTPGATETLSPGQSTTLNPGDSWVEPAGMIHFAENQGDEPVVILVSSLFPDGAAPATLINAATPTS